MLKPAAFACFLLLMASGPASAHPPITLTPQGEQAVIEEIEDFRKRLAAAIVAKDVGFLRKAYADSFSHTHTSSKADGKDNRIVSALAGDFVIENSPATEVRIRSHAGGWAAVATGITPTPVQPDGKVYAVHWTVTYARNQDQWQIVASHATRGREIVK
ncbi:MAG: nuclear transport factor 2 family protein [Rhizobiales bacterium]|nr:nuclear transport factor 2 family protein [Hyphomicrobiales bacterium]